MKMKRILAVGGGAGGAGGSTTAAETSADPTTKNIDADGRCHGADLHSGISAINGYIVGILPAPECENCCVDGEPAVAFLCDGLPLLNTPTAAFGTFSIKFNQKKSQFPEN